MAYKSLRLFGFGLFWRVGALTVVAVAGAFLFMRGFYLTGFTATAGVLLLTIELYRYVSRLNRDVEKLLLAIEYDDFTVRFPNLFQENRFRALYSALNHVIDSFRTIRKQREAEKVFLHRLLDHLSVALIVYKGEGAVEFINPAAKKLLKISRLSYIKDLSHTHPALATALLENTIENWGALRTSDSKPLAVSRARFTVNDEPITIVALQDVRRELEAQEWDAWQALMKVMTHEIMNSLTPITSLAAFVKQTLENPLAPGDIEDCRHALETIEKRGEGLLHFVQAYRSVIYLPQPARKRFPINEIFERLNVFLGQEPTAKGVKLLFNATPPRLVLNADPALVEQALINLGLNAFYALREAKAPFLSFNADLNAEGRVVIAIWDNGTGVDPEVRDKIFIPFFSTRPGGGGVGLSLCRQIMQLHGGRVTFESEIGRGSVFYLTF